MPRRGRNPPQRASRELDREPRTVPDQPAGSRGVWAGAAFLLIGTLAAYASAMDGGFIWDDDRYVTANALLRTADGLQQIWFDVGATIQYYPLVFTTFWVEYHLWGASALGYHLVNVLLHGLGAVLLWFVLRRLSLPGAWFAAAIFALHPVQVESVAWITERKNVLSGVFFLSALLSYLRFAPPGAHSGATTPAWRFYLLALILFVGALLSKTVTCSLPAVILLVLWWKRDRLTARETLPLIPMFLIGAGMALLTAWMETHSVGAAGADWALSATQRCLIAGRALWFYLGTLVFPWHLSFNYPRWAVDAGVWWQYLFPVGALVAVASLWWLRKPIGKGPVVAALLFGGTLVPALGFINTYPMRYSFVADHFQYLACISPITAFAAMLLGPVPRRVKGRFQHTRVPPVNPTISAPRHVVAALILVVLAVLTGRQGLIYKDLETLWHDTLAKNPASFLAHNNLGKIALDQGKLDQAVRHYTEALRAKPDFHEAHAGLGMALVAQGKIEEGKTCYREALKIKPNLAWAYNGLGQALDKQGDGEEALTHYRQAIRLDPGFPEAHNNLAKALARQGATGEAINHFLTALRLKPNWPRVHSNLANALAEQGRFDEAIRHYRESLRLRPRSAIAHRNLGLALENQGEIDEAIEEYQRAVELQPRDAMTHYFLGQLMSQNARVDEAIREFRATLRIDPRHTAAARALNTLLAAQDQPGGA